MKLLHPLALAFGLGAVPAFGQLADAPHRPHLLDFGAGQALNGSGDYLCLKTHLGYTYALGRHLSLGPRLALISGAGTTEFSANDFVPVSYQAVNVEAEAYYAPFGNDRRLVFALGAGAYAGHTRQYDFTLLTYRRDNRTGESTVAFRSRKTVGLHAGYVASLNADYAVDYQQRWLVGLKVALQNDTYGNIQLGSQLRLARRL